MAKEIFKTYKDVFDSSTIEALWWLITHRKIEGLESPIKVGKESNIFSALTKQNQRLAVKIYRIAACNFFQMSRYLSMDKRFRQVKSRKQTVLTWAKREFTNLLRAYQAGVSVPKPIALRENVLVMEFLGNSYPDSPFPYPLLKDSCVQPQKTYAQLIENIKILYQSAKLVHGDLSEFNILNKNSSPIIIDLSHAISTLSPASHELLQRDIANICRFFNKKGLKLSPAQIYGEITKGK